MKRWIAGVGIMMALLAGATAVAFASHQTHSSTITIDYSTSPKLTIFGKVKSSAHGCMVGRKVELLRGHTGAQTVVGSDKTDSHGKWSVTIDPPKAGRYQAQAVRQKFTHHGQKHTCKPARSPKIDISA
jgi:hypothetical protein